MTTIELSNGFITTGGAFNWGYTRRLIDSVTQPYNMGPGQSGLIGNSNPAIGAPGSAGLILIMKGTIPTNFTGLTSWGVRSSDVLVQYSRLSSQINVSFPGNNTALFSTPYNTASANGTATWFWLLSTQGSGGSTEPIWNQIIGTVGTLGSGADMQISSTNIVSGQSYRVITAQLTFPVSWTY